MTGEERREEIGIAPFQSPLSTASERANIAFLFL